MTSQAWKAIPSWAVIGTAIAPAELLAMAEQVHARLTNPDLVT